MRPCAMRARRRETQRKPNPGLGMVTLQATAYACASSLALESLLDFVLKKCMDTRKDPSFALPTPIIVCLDGIHLLHVLNEIRIIANLPELTNLQIHKSNYEQERTVYKAFVTSSSTEQAVFMITLHIHNKAPVAVKAKQVSNHRIIVDIPEPFGNIEPIITPGLWKRTDGVWHVSAMAL